MPRYLAATLALFALDQATKQHFVARYEEGEVRPIFGEWFALCRWHNTGAAFSIGSGNNFFFVALAAVALLALAVFAARGAFADAFSKWGAALLASGILGNVVDRVRHGYVVDFLLVDLGVWPADPWPAFNVADAAICTAVGLFLIASFREGKTTRTA